MNDHPYREFERSFAWTVLEQAVSDLVANSDLKEMTGRPYIVGYLVKCLFSAGLLKEEPVE